jgi:hypothetical protein
MYVHFVSTNPEEKLICKHKDSSLSAPALFEFENVRR